MWNNGEIFKIIDVGTKVNSCAGDRRAIKIVGEAINKLIS